ncbi:hypothetical protein [Saccharothrix longispora]|uniref:hypothetical protein n=1 Tax=Saccharothrix longispora TaxID=33920 RepID=UPI0028FD8E62|nr:hypothetical protein [Saccharothrix longispora]MBY8852141.1 hypothetical protein [Saccharothrix sp. MB29]MDU0292377.1 hypothetical protein [Saccharothrix longispora]
MTTVHHQALLRHFADLRDGNHGDGAVTRQEKERLFVTAVELLDPVARRVLDELDADLLLGAGTVSGTGTISTSDGGLHALWTLSWAEQVASGVAPIVLRAHYGIGFHHPHLSGGTVGEWPLNVFDADQAEAEAPTLRAIASADLHNLVFQADYRIVPATTAGR